jgi:hypothetical protein
MKVSPIYNINLNPIKRTNDSLAKPITKPITNPIEVSYLSSAAASAILAAAMIHKVEKPITEEQVENKLLQFGYEKKGENYLIKTLPKEELKFYEETTGRGADVYLKNVMNLSKEDTASFKEFLNINPKLGNKMFNENFENLLITFCNVKFNNQLNKLKHDKNFYNLITNIITNPPSYETKVSLNNYKGKVYEKGIAKDAQKYLRDKAVDSNVDTSDDVKKFIKNISSYIDTQKLPENMHLYRGERLYIMQNAQLGNGNTINLAEKMQNAAESKNYQNIEDVKSFIKNNDITVTQPAFMSTSVNQDSGFERKDWIFWDLTTDANTKGIYLDGLNTSFYTFQEELLVQKGAKIKIKDVSYDANKNIWYLKGNVSNE